MLYWTIFFVLLYFSFKEIYTKKIDVKAFQWMWIILILISVLRQGQGTDYYSYESIYNGVREISEYSIFYALAQSDPGYRLLNLIANQLHIPYIVFASLFSLIIFIIIYPFFKKQCNRSMIALFMFYASSFFIPYFLNQWRQAFAVAVFLRAFPYLLNGELKKYFLWIILASTVHLSAIILLVAPIIQKIRIGRNLMLVIAFICIIFLFINPFEFIISKLGFERLDFYIGNESTGAKYLAWLVRIILIIPMFLIPENLYKKRKIFRITRNFILSGFIIFCTFSFSELIASRLNIYFRVLEWYFAVLIIHHTKLKIISRQLCYCYLMFITVLFAKDIQGAISQGEYENCNILTYPYLSVFDDKETIEFYRKDI